MAKTKRKKKIVKIPTGCLKCDREFLSNSFVVKVQGKNKRRPIFKTCPRCRNQNDNMNDFGGALL